MIRDARPFAAAAALLALLGGPVAASELPATAGAAVQKVDAQTVAIRAENMPIAQLLSELSAFVPMESLYIEPGLEARPVTVQIDRVELREARVQVLAESGLNFVVYGAKVFVGDPGKGVLFAPTAGGTSVREARGRQITPEMVAAAADPAQRAEMLRQNRERRRAEAEARADEARATTEAWNEQHGTLEAAEHTMVGENVIYKDPNFVPYKMTEAAKRARRAIDVTKLP